MRITSKGQVTIPQDVREGAGQMLAERLRGRADFKMTTDQVMALMRGPTADQG